jgi:copper chaperone CopZ
MARLTPERTQHLQISGMKGPACAVKVEETLRKLAGVEDVQVEVSEGVARIAGDVDANALIDALSYTDYQAQPLRR